MLGLLRLDRNAENDEGANVTVLQQEMGDCIFLRYRLLLCNGTLSLVWTR